MAAELFVFWPILFLVLQRAVAGRLAPTAHVLGFHEAHVARILLA